MTPQLKKTKAPRQTRNAPRARARILAEATRIFAQHGYEGTSINDVIRASKINKRMVYHYFDDKKGLYRAVFAHQWIELKDWFDRALKRRMDEAGGTTPGMREVLLEALDLFFDFMAANPAFTRLLMWDGLEGGEMSRSIWKEIRGPLFVQIDFIVRQAQDEGVLDRRFSPAHFVISFLGAVGFYFGYAPTLKDMLGKDALSPEGLRERKKQLELLLTSLIPGKAAG